MENSIFINEKNFNLNIIRKQNIKHIYLRLKDSNNIEIRTNKFISEKYILDFIYKKSIWILKNSKNLSQKENLPDHKIKYLGKIYDKSQLLQKNINIDNFYKNSAKEFILPIVEKYAHIMNLYPTQVKFRKNKSRWGSCSSKNNINLNTELMKQDIKFIEYVVVHELAHIKHKNHKKEFWDLVEKYLPDFKQRKRLCYES